jgi:transglutaminase-like putative cysteine protease
VDRSSPLPTTRARELAQAAHAAGCRVLAHRELRDGSHSWPVVELECGDNANAIRFLDRAATLDAGDTLVRDLALRMRGVHGGELATAKAIQAFVRSAVRFVREARETFQHTLYTLRRRAGDCDDHARAVAALARAAGLRAHVVGVPNARGQVGHVAPMIAAAGKKWWAETTVDARFGEHPRAAARRLGITSRPDIWSERRAAMPGASP